MFQFYYIESTAHQTIHFGLCTLLLLRFEHRTDVKTQHISALRKHFISLVLHNVHDIAYDKKLGPFYTIIYPHSTQFEQINFLLTFRLCL
jgi:hypothetical protein